MVEHLNAIVIGALNIDLIITGLPRFARAGEQVNGDQLRLLPGGKGRNIATMLAAWLGPDRVGMVGKLVQDRFGLYRVPLESLAEAGVNTAGVQLEDGGLADLPTLAVFLNTVDQARSNYYLPGKNETLSPADLEAVRPLFQTLAADQGVVLLTLEMPLETACYALKMAEKMGLRVMLDPGGQPPDEAVDFSSLFAHPIFLLKPNHQEAARLTGVAVTDFASAKQAAKKLLSQNVRHVVITHEEQGAYVFSGSDARHIPVPRLATKAAGESTGCGDQMMAVLCAGLLSGHHLFKSAQQALLAATIQYYQAGTAPITPADLRDLALN